MRMGSGEGETGGVVELLRREMGTELESLRSSGALCDVELESESGERLPAHRLVLASLSSYLRALFRHAPSAQPPATLVVTADVPTSTLNSLLHYAYTGSLDIPPSAVENLVRIGDLWAMDHLLSLVSSSLTLTSFSILCLPQISDYVLKQLSMANAVGLWKFGLLYPRLGIVEPVRKFLLYNLEEMFLAGGSTEAQSLDANQMSDLLTDDWLRMSREEEVVEVVRKWALGGPERRSSLPKLLSALRVGLCRSREWASVDASGLDPASIQALTLANPKSTQPRLPQNLILAIGGWSQGAPTSALEAFNFNSNSWTRVGPDNEVLSPDGPTPRAYHGIAQVKGEVYLVGGFDGTDYYNSVRAWDPVSGVWRSAACMYVARCYVSVAVLAGEIYALGGFDGRNRLASAEKFDPAKFLHWHAGPGRDEARCRNQWSLLPNMSTARSDACAVTYKERIYVIGGFDGHNVLSSVECWDAGVGQWHEVAGMATPRSGVSACVADGEMWVFGGFDGEQRLNSGEHYDGEGWQACPPMLGARSNFALLALPGPDPSLLAVGGYNGQQTVATVERFSLVTRWWRPLESMHLNRSALKAILIQGLPESRLLVFLHPPTPHTLLHTPPPAPE